jgi:DNA-binding Lrp family transcriptional regulator
LTDLDRIDLALLTALQNDARVSNKELAAKAGLAPSSTLGRVQRLRDAGILRGAHAEVDGAALGIGLEAFVFIRLVGHAQHFSDPLREHLLAQPEVGSYWSVGGDDDVVLHVRVRDSQHLHELLQTRVGSRPEVGRVRTEIIFEHVRKPVLPSYLGADTERPGRRRP